MLFFLISVDAESKSSLKIIFVFLVGEELEARQIIAKWYKKTPRDIANVADVFLRRVIMNKIKMWGMCSRFRSGTQDTERIFIIEISTLIPQLLNERQILTTFIHELIHIPLWEISFPPEEELDKVAFYLVDKHQSEIRKIFLQHCKNCEFIEQQET